MEARRLQRAGAVGGIVVDNSPSSSSDAAPLFAMSGDGTEDVHIPLVFLYSSDADVLFKALLEDPQLKVTLAESIQDKGIGFILCCDEPSLFNYQSKLVVHFI